ncbi:MAG TPA: tetratricopeptide repeat protein [Burkholderiales bacterium]|nr:tetratricopeptide repeat protein [Burkholderiales bacterium]
MSTLRTAAVLVTVVFAAALLAACAGPLALVPWTPLLSATLASRGDDPQTRKTLNDLQLKNDWPGVTRLARERLAPNPANPDWLLILGYAQLQQGEYGAALDTLDTATRINPEDIDAWNLLAEGQRLLHQNDKAARTLRRAMSVDAASPVSPYLLGEIDREAGRLDRAIAFYRRSVQLESEYTPAWYAMGLCFIRQGRQQELDEVLAALKKLEPRMAVSLEQQAKAPK